MAAQSRFSWMRSLLLPKRTKSRFDEAAALWRATSRARTLRSIGSPPPEATFPAMKIYETIEEMRAACRAARHGGQRLGFVPTMGALHEGHLSLIRAAKAACDIVAASIFVNPTQFGPNEDLARYPRDFKHDRDLLAKEGVEMLFAPSVEEMYPAGAVTWVTVEG